MKNMDRISQRILAISLSLMGLILCSTLFVATISPATASDNASNVSSLNEEKGGGGKYMMDYTSVHVPSQDKTYYEVLVWNTDTGQSRLYYYSYSDKIFKAYEDNVQLPTNPLD